MAGETAVSSVSSVNSASTGTQNISATPTNGVYALPVPPVSNIDIYGNQVANNWNPSLWGKINSPTGSNTTAGFQA